MNKIITIIFSFAFLYSPLVAQQLDLSAEIRPRYEYKHGYKSLAKIDQGAASFISQRTRLNVNYKNKKISLGVVVQNVRVWGESSTLSANDIASSFHQAWAQYNFNPEWSVKMGRQEIVYDDHRIFGSVGWAQQARSHDAFIVKYKKDKHSIHLGLAFNADNQSGVGTLYSNRAGYKSFQYLRYHGDFNKLGLSFLILNTENELSVNAEIVSYNMQTIGPRFTYKTGDLSTNAAFYIQTGESKDNTVSAYYYTLNANYKISNFKLGLGFEFLSGKDQNDTETDLKSFAPLFGTNHKFNGWMDYFYVGNHGNSVGLVDINFPMTYAKNKLSVKLIPHLFSAAADVYDDSNTKMSSNLGTEVDLNIGYKLSKDVKVNLGYSVMLATETMEVLKGGSKDEGNTWGWLMFTFKPSLFSYKAEQSTTL